MKKLISIFLLLMLTIQILPLKQVGNLLFSNQWTEELPHSLDVEKGFCKKMQGKSDFIDWADGHFFVPTSEEDSYPVIAAVAIPHNHAFEILVPPPNC